MTSFWRTVFDCLASFPFADALAIADAALRRSGLARQEMIGLLRTRFRHCPGVRRAAAICVWAEPTAESGREPPVPKARSGPQGPRGFPE